MRFTRTASALALAAVVAFVGFTGSAYASTTAQAKDWAERPGSLTTAGLNGATIDTAATASTSWTGGRQIYTVTRFDDPNPRCLDSGGRGWVGSQLNMWGCAWHANKSWELQPVGAAGYLWIMIRNEATQLCAGVLDQVKGHRVVSLPCNSGDHRVLWLRVQSGPGGSFGPRLLRNFHSGWCLNIEGASLANGAKLSQWNCSFTWWASWYGVATGD